MQIHDVHQGVHRRKKRKRVGRGIGSGHGKTSTKGHKGHASRQGFKLSPIFEGGQMPLARRVPKRGFVNGAFKKWYAIVNLADLEARFEPGTVVDEKRLRASGLVKGHEFDGIKVLGDGILTKPLDVHATKFSGSAAAKIAAAGGKTVVVSYKPHSVRARPQAEGQETILNAGTRRPAIPDTPTSY
jgi:large subunit ribosomal protein L15